LTPPLGHTAEQRQSLGLRSSRAASFNKQLPSDDQEDDCCHDLFDRGLLTAEVIHNGSPATLYEHALKYEPGTYITSSGALATSSGTKTGRSPKDKRITEGKDSAGDIWWGPVNMKLSEHSFMINRERSIDFLNTRDRLYVVDGYAGWDPDYRIKIRVICARAYHALFMHNMLIRPEPQDLPHFVPDYYIFNAGGFPANRYTQGMTSATSISLNFERKEFVILGSQYAGEMKKGVFTIMHYLMPKRGLLSLHSSANEGKDGDVTLFFGLSGTGKTTLSADPQRMLIGDDEHVWSDKGVFNIEGGCYAKAVGLTHETEPEIFEAIRFGTVLENIVFDPFTRKVDFDDISLTENTRCSYPIEFIPNAKIPCIGGHPQNIVLLTCDAFGVLPPVSRLTPAQTMYHFISGYTAKVAGTEEGIVEPQAAFSACFGEPFLVWHPTKYASMLAEKMKHHSTNCYLVNTGWSGGKYGVGKRLKLAWSRAIIDAIHNGELQKAEYEKFDVFGLNIPKRCTGVPDEVLNPRNAWADVKEFDSSLKSLASLFVENFSKYQDKADSEVIAAGPATK